MKQIRRKWRPSLALVVAGVCVVLVSVPVMALLAMRLTSNQFVRETEQTLIHQAAIYARVYAKAFEAQGGPVIGPELDPAMQETWTKSLHPFRPQLNVRVSEVGPSLGNLPRGDPAPLDPRHQAIAEELQTLAKAAGKTTLAGAIFLDHQGHPLSAETPWFLADQREIQTALSGRVASTLRTRGDVYERHPLASLSRDTGYRVFVAYPVILGDRVIGAVYLSRTPSNLGKFLFQERYALGVMLAATLLTAIILGFLLLRLILRPVRGLSEQSRQIAAGELEEPTPLPHYGIRELAVLGTNVMSMAQTLKQRSAAIVAYTDHVTHELKSPITTIIGAAELLQSSDLQPSARIRLEQNLLDEGLRMNALLERLRELTRLRNSPASGPTRIAEMLPAIEGLQTLLETDPTALVPLSREHGQMILHHMAQNAREHGAQGLFLSLASNVLTIQDDGNGIPAENIPKVTEPFFTTRRETGGTGMGLAIIAAILEIYGAELRVLTPEKGAGFEIHFERG